MTPKGLVSNDRGNRSPKMLAALVKDRLVEEPMPVHAGTGPTTYFIRQPHSVFDRVLGSPQVWRDLHYAGKRCGPHRVARPIRWAGLHGLSKRRCWRTKP